MNFTKLRNIGGLFRDTRTRTIILFTSVVLIIGVVVGIIRLTKDAPLPDTSAKVNVTPNIQSIPGGFDQSTSEEYARLQEQQNIMQAKIAEQQGSSAIPTIIRATNIGQKDEKGAGSSNAACCTPCPCTGKSASGLPPLLPSKLVPGTLVYDNQGRVIGTVGADGKVRDANGNIIGTVGPDGLVRDANGNVIGAAGGPATGTPVYDAEGRLLGTVGADGKVRDASGKIIGTVDADGSVRNLSGNIIGKTGSNIAGTPVYDAEGRLIGTVGPDGKVRDANGKVIGTVDADGNVKNADGKIIGKAAKTVGGTPVYDAQGRLIGTVGSDGKVRDASGKVIGTVSADGTVHDANGNVIGKSGAVVPGAPVYDTQGRLIGTVGPDGKVRDANGKLLGTISPDGTVRNINGNIIGKSGPTAPGTPIYDAQGRLIGTVGADGIVRDANGKALGTVGLDGQVRDNQGNILGSTSPLGGDTTTTPIGIGGTSTGTPNQQLAVLPGSQPTQDTQLNAILQRQAQQISQQKAEQLQQQIQTAMATQVNQLFDVWRTGGQQQYVEAAAASNSATSGNAAGPGKASVNATSSTNDAPAVKAGTIMYAVLLTSVNSDEPGPVLASIVDGKFKGGRLIGGLTNQGEKVLLSFNTLTLPNVSRSIQINTVAIDQNTARTALSSYTDRHYLLRYGTLFASAFLQGYGQAFQNSGATVVSNGLQTNTTYPDINPKGKFFVALGNVGQQYSSKLSNVVNTPPTVYVNSGSAMGILFLNDVSPLPK